MQLFGKVGTKLLVINKFKLGLGRLKVLYTLRPSKSLWKTNRCQVIQLSTTGTSRKSRKTKINKHLMIESAPAYLKTFPGLQA